MIEPEDSSTFIAARNVLADVSHITRAAARGILVGFSDSEVASIAAVSAEGGADEARETVDRLIHECQQKRLAKAAADVGVNADSE